MIYGSRSGDVPGGPFSLVVRRQVVLFQIIMVGASIREIAYDLRDGVMTLWTKGNDEPEVEAMRVRGDDTGRRATKFEGTGPVTRTHASRVPP